MDRGSVGWEPAGLGWRFVNALIIPMDGQFCEGRAGYLRWSAWRLRLADLGKHETYKHPTRTHNACSSKRRPEECVGEFNLIAPDVEKT